MKLNRDFWRNPNIYTAIVLIITFLWFAEIIPNAPFDAPDYMKFIFIIGAAASLVFLYMRIMDK